MASALKASSATAAMHGACRIQLSRPAPQPAFAQLPAPLPLRQRIMDAGALHSKPFLSGSSIVRFNERPAPRPLAAVRPGNALTLEANLFSRFGRVLRATFFFYGDAAVSRGEDPVRMLDTVVDEMQGDLIRMRQTAAQVLAAQRMLESKYNDAVRGADDWGRRAELAVRSSNDDLAREALRRKKAFTDLAATQKGQLDQHTKASESLFGSIRVMESKLSEAKSKKETLKARAKSAEASKMVNEQLSGMLSGLRSSTDSSMAAFAKMEEKVMALEAEAEGAAMVRLLARTPKLLPASDTLESRFAMLEGGAGGIDDELVKLKTNMLAGASAKTLRLSDTLSESGYINIPVR